MSNLPSYIPPYLTPVAHGGVALLTGVHLVRWDTEADGAQYVIGGVLVLCGAIFRRWQARGAFEPLQEIAERIILT